MNDNDLRSRTATSSPGGPGASVLDCSRLWDVKDVSAFLGVPVGTLYQWRVRGEGPPAMRLGRHLRFDPAAVRTWVSQQAVH